MNRTDTINEILYSRIRRLQSDIAMLERYVFAKFPHVIAAKKREIARYEREIENNKLIAQ